jgi:hypothetical protein
MLFSADAWPGIRDGSITVTFRAWKRPQARTGGRSRTPVGVLAIDDVRRVPVEAITREEARMAGYTSLSELRARLEPAREVYRIAFHLAPTRASRCGTPPGWTTPMWRRWTVG